ncbi:alpha/beta hydrolase [Kribbella sp. VKM Ac-2568]|uniref:alpha/beta hydrolase n=1 Tax=Kribbella sp. VKM Ac-2568 TaxID=2512219 RepID=UPI00104F108D|nr:alpha/beta fold hydrolase [Kribbella sp. VKM Ac-2568]TCM50557.1 serine aminopeptidase S33 family [Kribbella sp. VKM Ac-2568]
MAQASVRRLVLRAGLLFAAGCVLLAVGVGVGVPYLDKAGLHPVTVVGLAVLATGLVSVGIGGTTLVRATRSWRRVLVLPALLAALVIALLSLGQAVAATNVPPTAVGTTTPADRGLPFSEVRFATTDGLALAGWYIPSRNRAAVVLLHGAGSTRSNVLEHAVVLARHGYGVLLFDARGHGRSEGRAMDFGWYGDQDVSAAVSFLQAQPAVNDELIAALGLSMGGEEAIGAAAHDQRIRAVVAEGATNRVSADKAWLSDEFGWRGTLQEGMDRLTYGITDLLTAADQPIALRDAVAASAPRSVLLIAGGDRADEGHANHYIQSASPATVDLWIVPGTGHTAALDTHPAQWEHRVTAYLADALHLDEQDGLR